MFVLHSVSFSESCTGEALANLGKRLGDWFQLLHGNAKHNKSAKPAAATASGLLLHARIPKRDKNTLKVAKMLSSQNSFTATPQSKLIFDVFYRQWQ